MRLRAYPSGAGGLAALPQMASGGKVPVASLGVGIGVDYALYVLTWILAKTRDGHDLETAYHETLKSMGHDDVHHDSQADLGLYWTQPVVRLWWRATRRYT